MRTILLYCLFCAFPILCCGQNNSCDNRSFYEKYYNVKSQSTCEHSNDYAVFGNHDNIINKPFNFLLWFYKKLLSAQISADCDFSPSCSRFSYQAIQEFGLIKGIFLTADRLTRCNGVASADAPFNLIDTRNAKVNDYPALYRISGR